MNRRPIERRVLRLSAEGHDDAEIAARFHRHADYIAWVGHSARGQLAGWATPDTAP